MAIGRYRENDDRPKDLERFSEIYKHTDPQHPTFDVTPAA
jgi:hypothetical protein